MTARLVFPDNFHQIPTRQRIALARQLMEAYQSLLNAVPKIEHEMSTPSSKRALLKAKRELQYSVALCREEIRFAGGAL